MLVALFPPGLIPPSPNPACLRTSRASLACPARTSPRRSHACALARLSRARRCVYGAQLTQLFGNVAACMHTNIALLETVSRRTDGGWGAGEGVWGEGEGER